jgi:TRAP-type C4-dicarboxylate transport system permease small subunit
MDETPIGRLVFRLATAVAIMGGVALVVVTAVTVVSVVGRALIPFGLKPILGDYEFVQVGVLFAIFCSLPLTQYLRGHADVALLTDRFAPRIAALIELIMDVLTLIAFLFVVWRYTIGMMDKFANREMTLLLHIPVWAIYAVGMMGAITAVIVAIYCAARSAANSFSRDPIKPEPGIF